MTEIDPIDGGQGRCAAGLELALAARVSASVDAAQVAVARTLAATLDRAVADGASPNAIAAVSKELNATLAGLRMTPASRGGGQHDDPVAQLLDELAGGPAVRDPAQ